ncbi:MAG: hypothetical protein ACI9LM_004465 [Alteromonadaceae bacterium]|jgi:hypothetical protein
MKKGIALVLAMLSSSVLADPAIFGMELGEMTEKDLKSKYSVNHTGTNKYSNGNMYSVPVSSINFEGLKEVTTIFNTEGKLVAVLTSLPKNKFNYLNETLGGKYKLISQKIPFVGNKKATYRDGETEITLNAPHMGFDMSMNYVNDDLMQAFNRQSQAETRKKQQSESSQL